ncbi:MAG: hypothetical protein K0R49_548 [Burkholderiales bacterium]|jgi:hypothetical protein|nr:hypothetical protein [Burkholderiales bacterium]
MKKKDFIDILNKIDIITKANKMKFVLPVGITVKKELLDNGRYGYIVRDTNLGQLGHILIVPNGNQSQIVCEVSGDADDPMTVKRQMILDPIAKEIAYKMTAVCGKGSGEIRPYDSPRQQHCIKSIMHPCEVCKKAAALLIFADDATTNGQLEDYAMLMHSKIKEFNVPTWVIGLESENIVNGEDLRKSLTLKIKNNRRVIEILTPDDVIDEVDELIQAHCSIK